MGSRSTGGLKEGLVIYYANYTSFGPKAESYLDSEGLKNVHVHLGVETHLNSRALRAARRSRSRAGYKSYVCPAVDTGRGGNSGGAWVLVQKGLVSHGALPGFCFEEGLPSTTGEHWTAARLRVKNFDIVFISAYLEAGVGLNETNVRRLTQLADFIKCLRVPFVVMADWNIEPYELVATGWDRFVQGTIVTPRDVTFTCNQGRGRMLDYAVVANSLVPYFSLRVDPDSPWKPHVGLMATIEIEVERASTRILCKPVHVEEHFGPYRQWGYYFNMASGDCPEASYPIDSQACSSDLTQRYAKFSRAFELCCGDVARVERGHMDKYMGKGCPAKFKIVPSQKPNPLNHITKDSGHCYWVSVHARVLEFLRQRLHHPDSEPQASALVQGFGRAATKVQKFWMQAFQGKVDMLYIVDSLRCAGTSTVPQISELLCKLKVCEKLSHHELMNGRRRSFSEWLFEALKGGARVAHAMSTADSRVQEPPDVVIANGRVLAEPIQVLESRVQFWSGFWGSREPNKNEDWLGEVKDAALKQLPEIQPIEYHQVEHAIAHSPVRTGVGSDVWSVRQWHSAPHEGKQMLTDILNDVERTLTFPAQVLLNVIALLGKPQGGERPITLTTAPYRLYSKIRKTFVTEWEATRAGFWDSAVKGSTPLRAALIRELYNEVAVYMGLAVAQILWDMEKFYDLLNPGVMAKLALQLEYPVVPLYLGLLVHRAARVLSLKGCFSEPHLPETSILAGCFQSVAWSRCFLYDVLEDIHNRYRPITISSWVDDLSQRVQGLRSHVVAKTVQAASDLVSSLRRKGARISTKSVIRCSDPKLSKHIQQVLRGKGIDLKMDVEARDLGLDSTCAKRRRLRSFKNRFAKGLARAGVIKNLVKVNKQARRLITTGAKPQLVWGHQGKGMAPTTLKKLKSTLAVCSGLRKTGGCTTSALQLQGGEESDPEFFIRHELLDTWLRVWQELPRLRMAIAVVWGKLVAKLEVPSRWSRTTGLVGAVVSTLFDIGWKPEGPISWRDHSGELLDIDLSQPSAFIKFRATLLRSLQLRIWSRASKHFLGTGLEEGVDWVTARKHLRWWEKRGLHQHAGVFRTVSQGAFWTRDRKKLAGYIDSDLCPRCKVAQETPFHQFWECSANLQLGLEVESTQSLVILARQQHTMYPCLWLRGLVPKGWTIGRPEGRPKKQTWGCLSGPRYDIPEGVLAASDGSGGEQGQDARLARVGWGLVLLSRSSANLLGLSFGSVPGGQTVPRAELYALVELVRSTEGFVEVLIDSSYAVEGYAKGPVHHQSANQDLWDNLWRSLEGRREGVLVTKVAAHFAKLDSQPPLHTIANTLADVAANRGAKLAALPPEEVRAVKEVDDMAWAIQSRIVCISLSVVTNFSQPKPRAKQRVPLARGVQVQEGVNDSGHDLRSLYNRIVCTRCLKTGPKNRTLGWVEQPCNRELPQGLHPSHSPHFRIYRGLFLCFKCGSWGKTRLVNLKKPCQQRLSIAGKQVLKRICKGKKPYGLKSWPDED